MANYPYVDWMPYKDKHWVHKYLQPFYFQMLYFISPPATYMTRFAKGILEKDGQLSWKEDIMPVLQLLTMVSVGAQNNVEMSHIFWLWIFMHCVSAYWGFFTR